MYTNKYKNFLCVLVTGKASVHKQYKNFLSGLVTGKASVHKQIQELFQWLSDRKG